MRAKVDQFLNKWFSRKLLVFIVSAFALFSGRVDGDSWIIIATAYIGTEGVIDAVTRLKGFKQNSNN